MESLGHEGTLTMIGFFDERGTSYKMSYFIVRCCG